METATVYHIFCTITGKCYIGQTWDTIDKRWVGHLSKSSGCLHLKRALKLHGEKHFVKTALTCGLTTQEQADAAETYWIGYFDSIKNGYNLKDGGARGRFSEETRAKMSESAKKRKPMSEETRAKLRKRSQNMSEETRAKIGAAGRGRVVSEETKAKIREAKKNLSEESRKRISQAKLGNKNGAGNKGKVVPPEVREKIRQTLIKRSNNEGQD